MDISGIPLEEIGRYIILRITNFHHLENEKEMTIDMWFGISATFSVNPLAGGGLFCHYKAMQKHL